MIRPAPIVAALPASTPFIGPERLMRQTGRYSLVRLGANESPFGPSPKAIAAMTAELDRLSWYGDPDSLDLRDALAEKHRCSPGNVLVAAGIDDVMGLAVRAYVAPGTVAVTSRGTYPTFEYHMQGCGGSIERVDYRADGTPDLQGLAERAHATKAALVYLANPDNPSGSFIAPEDVVTFYDALPHDAVLFLDEAYADFVDDAFLPVIPMDDRLVRARTFSKAYGLAGARIGYVVSTTEGVATLGKIRLQYGVNRNAQIAAIASLQDDEFRDEIVRETARGRDEYHALAEELGLRSLESHTNFVCIDMGAGAAHAASVMNELLERGVWVRKPGAPPLDPCIRVTVGTKPMRDAFAAALREIVAGVPS